MKDLEVHEETARRLVRECEEAHAARGKPGVEQQELVDTWKAAARVVQFCKDLVAMEIHERTRFCHRCGHARQTVQTHNRVCYKCEPPEYAAAAKGGA